MAETPNRYRAQCFVCRKTVEPGMGAAHKVPSGWAVRHFPCHTRTHKASKAAPTMPSLVPNTIRLERGEEPGFAGWGAGDIWNSKAHGWVKILRAGWQSFGGSMGDDARDHGAARRNGRLYWADARPVTPDDDADE